MNSDSNALKRQQRLKDPIAVVGGQWGSEAKGAVTAYLCQRHNIDYAVRTGSVNAGHTVYYQEQEYKMQQLPVGWVNPRTNLVLGAGAFIFNDILRKEVNEVEDKARLLVRNRLLIDHRVAWHGMEHTVAATEAGRHYKMGATGKGCSEALVDKIKNRGSGYALFANRMESEWLDKDMFVDTSRVLNDAYDAGKSILLEGTQGAHLDMNLGPYPFTTHKMTNAAQWVAEAGMSPALPWSVVMVVRTFPIRVAGNSGPMPGEISWDRLAFEINKGFIDCLREPLVDHEAILQFQQALRNTTDMWPGCPDPLKQHEWTEEERYKWQVALSEMNKTALASLSSDIVEELKCLFEMTTVTKKLRRVARINFDVLRESVMWNRPKWLAVTFLNYQFPRHWGVVEGTYQANAVWADSAVIRYLSNIEAEVNVPVRWVSTGPMGYQILENPKYIGMGV